MLLLSSEVGNLFEQLTFWIAKLAYTLIGSMYKLFFSLANAQLFNNELISSFTNRIYYIIGVVMLFVFVYIILTNIINPDGGKSSNSPISVIKNVVIALAIIVFTPTMFELAYSVQSSVFENNVIGRLVLGGSSSDTQTYDSANGFVSTLLNSSFSVDSDAPEGALTDLESAEFLLSYDGDFSGYEGLINSSNEYISYNGLISLIVACFCGYVLLGYLLDVALRAFKLGFLQVIAPIPAVMSIVPNQSKILSSWVKESLKTFFEVFLKIAALMFVVFMIGQVNNNLGDIFGNNGFFFNAFVIIGLFSFIKVLPKLLSQIFGFSDSSGIFNTKAKISSLKDNIKETFAPLSNFSSRAIGTVGGGISAMHAYKQATKNNPELDTKFRRTSAVFHGMRNGFKGGIKGIGDAYRYEQNQQIAYANKPNITKDEYNNRMAGINKKYDDMLNNIHGSDDEIKKERKRLLQLKKKEISDLNMRRFMSSDFIAASLNSLRDNIGMPSIYDERVYEAHLNRDRKNNPLYHQLGIANELARQYNDMKNQAEKLNYEPLTSAISDCKDWVGTNVSTKVGENIRTKVGTKVSFLNRKEVDNITRKVLDYELPQPILDAFGDMFHNAESYNDENLSTLLQVINNEYNNNSIDDVKMKNAVDLVHQLQTQRSKYVSEALYSGVNARTIDSEILSLENSGEDVAEVVKKLKDLKDTLSDELYEKLVRGEIQNAEFNLKRAKVEQAIKEIGNIKNTVLSDDLTSSKLFSVDNFVTNNNVNQDGKLLLKMLSEYNVGNDSLLNGLLNGIPNADSLSDVDKLNFIMNNTDERITEDNIKKISEMFDNMADNRTLLSDSLKFYKSFDNKNKGLILNSANSTTVQYLDVTKTPPRVIEIPVSMLFSNIKQINSDIKQNNEDCEKIVESYSFEQKVGQNPNSGNR